MIEVDVTFIQNLLIKNQKKNRPIEGTCQLNPV